MLQYIIRRLIYGVILVFVLVIVLFFAINVLGDPVALMLPADAPPEQYARALHDYGYDRPVVVRLLEFMGNVVRLDFGKSLVYRKPAGEIFADRFPKTLKLALSVLAIALPLGLALGVIAGLKPLSLIDRVVSVLSFAAVAMPPFWLALILIVFLAVQLSLLPTSGFGSGSDWKYFVLPVMSLAFRPMGRIAQLTRSSLSEEVAKNYVTVARAKGLSEKRVIWVHALKNAMNPVITLGAGEIIALLNATVAIEWIFGWPGISSLLIESIVARDLYVVETCLVAIGIIVVFVNLSVDILYSYFDPRIVYK